MFLLHIVQKRKRSERQRGDLIGCYLWRGNDVLPGEAGGKSSLSSHFLTVWRWRSPAAFAHDEKHDALCDYQLRHIKTAWLNRTFPCILTTYLRVSLCMCVCIHTVEICLIQDLWFDDFLNDILQGHDAHHLVERVTLTLIVNALHDGEVGLACMHSESRISVIFHSKPLAVCR